MSLSRAVLSLHAGNRTVPAQLVVRSSRASNNAPPFPYETSLLDVRTAIPKVLTGENPGTVADEDHSSGTGRCSRRAQPLACLRASDLAGYRHTPVFIRPSMHVPPSSEAVRDAMTAFFEMLTLETEPAVRVVLGHFIFVYIHPYMDGNGRIGRFLMNVMLAAGGYLWTVVPLTRRNDYMSALDSASVGQDIKPFAQFLARLVEDSTKGRTAALPSS